MNDPDHHSGKVPRRQSRLRHRHARPSATTACIAEQIDGPGGLGINSFLALSRDRALAQAARVDAMAARGEDAGPLAGVPIGIKDVLAMTGAPATAGSKILAGYLPPYDATVVQSSRPPAPSSWASSTATSSPWAPPTRTPPTAPSATRAHSTAFPAAPAEALPQPSPPALPPPRLGTDTGGSIRQPAAFCGVVGVLPTYGRVSRFGLIAFASSLDRVGPFTANVTDAATMLYVLAGQRPPRRHQRGPPRRRLRRRPPAARRRPSRRHPRRVLRRGPRPRDPRRNRACPRRPRIRRAASS